MDRPEADRPSLLAELKREIDVLNESTVCEKTELNWPASVNPGHVFNNIRLWLRVNAEILFPGLRKVDRRFMESD
jgi:hypothetical protein